MKCSPHFFDFLFFAEPPAVQEPGRSRGIAGRVSDVAVVQDGDLEALRRQERAAE